VCQIDGCGKCFARGEHLKRHVRSIHTNEKRQSHRISLYFRPADADDALFLIAHLCLYPGCDKAFSRHDNLGQHMRIHGSKRR
jgi:uncharacterized Zn-finger protein